MIDHIVDKNGLNVINNYRRRSSAHFYNSEEKTRSIPVVTMDR